MDQDGTWHGGGPWSRPHCARWGPSSPPQKGAEPPIFCTFLLHQTAGCIKVPLGMEIGLSPGDFVLDGPGWRKSLFKKIKSDLKKFKLDFLNLNWIFF